MKSFLRENKLRLLLLGIPVLCLIVLWNINIYKIWYDRTPWKNLGMPFYQTVKQLSHVHFGVNYSYPYVVVEDGSMYSFDWIGQWRPEGYPEYPDYEKRNIEEEHECARKIELLWNLESEKDKSSKIIEARGACAYYSFDNYQYAVFKISQDGEILEKYVNGKEPRIFRNWATFYLCLFLVLSAPIWTRLFFQFDFLKPKPDYNAK